MARRCGSGIPYRKYSSYKKQICLRWVIINIERIARQYIAHAQQHSASIAPAKGLNAVAEHCYN